LCNPCLRNELSPLSQEGHTLFAVLSSSPTFPASTHARVGSNMEASIIKKRLRRLSAGNNPRVQRVPIGQVAGRKRPYSRPLRREPAPAHMPEPTSATSAERFKRPIHKEDLDARACHRMTSKGGLCRLLDIVMPRTPSVRRAPSRADNQQPSSLGCRP